MLSGISGDSVPPLVPDITASEYEEMGGCVAGGRLGSDLVPPENGATIDSRYLNVKLSRVLQTELVRLPKAVHLPILVIWR